MSFNWQPNMFFGMCISFMCDLHIKLDILNPLNIFFFLSNGFLNASFALQPFFSKFQDFEIFEWFGFSSSSSNEHVLLWKGEMFLLYKKSIVWFYAFLLIFFLKMYFRHLIFLAYRTPRDINIVSKLFLNYFINLKKHHFIYWHITIHYNYNNVR